MLPKVESTISFADDEPAANEDDEEIDATWLPEFEQQDSRPPTPSIAGSCEEQYNAIEMEVIIRKKRFDCCFHKVDNSNGRELGQISSRDWSSTRC